MSASAFVAAMAFQSIVEFEDVNGDGIYSDSEDLLLSSYDFLLPKPSAQPLWGPTELTVAQLPSGASEFKLNTTTQDGVFSIQISVSDTVCPLHNAMSFCVRRC